MVETASRPANKTHVQYRNGAGRKSRNAPLTKEQQAVADARKRWEDTTVASSLTRLPERDPDAYTTISGEPIERIYTPADLGDFDYDRDLGFPGEYPFTPGVHPTMYRSRLWTMRMFAGFGSADEPNPPFI